MLNKPLQLREKYEQQGYFLIKNCFTETEIIALRKVILKFYDSWKKENQIFYEEEAFNASLITGTQYLKELDRLQLFKFISSKKIMKAIESIITNKPVFMNTQLFFNPVSPEQKDFWHRDCQYDHDLESQKVIINETQVVHLRVPLFDELGIELIPGTHKRWDNEEEFNVRQEINGRLSSDDLNEGEKVPLNAGDLLVFSADMIHRGLYGMDRLALDILVFDCAADYVDYIDEDCLPTKSMLKEIDSPLIFQNSMDLKSHGKI